MRELCVEIDINDNEKSDWLFKNGSNYRSWPIMSTDRMLVMDDISELNSTIWFLKYGVGHGFKKESN